MIDLIEVVSRRARQPVQAGLVDDGSFVEQIWPAVQARLAQAGSEAELLAAAVEVAAGAERLATVFVAGYQAALRALLVRAGVGLGGAEQAAILCLAATEAGGARPSAIQTRLTVDADGFNLQGAKQWTTGAGPAVASHFLVVARRGERQLSDGKRVADLVVVRVDSTQAGVEVSPMPPTAFIPEVPHGRPNFSGVHVAQASLLPGDGYTQYLKPFRTAEDIFVMGSVAAYLLSYALRRDQQQMGVLCAHVLQSLQALVQNPWLEPCVHLALAGIVESMGRAASMAETLWTDDAAQLERWRRDQVLLHVAGRAREARAHSAWDSLR